LRHEQLGSVLEPRLVEDFNGPLQGHRQEHRRSGFRRHGVQPLDDVGDDAAKAAGSSVSTTFVMSFMAHLRPTAVRPGEPIRQR